MPRPPLTCPPKYFVGTRVQKRGRRDAILVGKILQIAFQRNMWLASVKWDSGGKSVERLSRLEPYVRPVGERRALLRKLKRIRKESHRFGQFIAQKMREAGMRGPETVLAYSLIAADDFCDYELRLLGYSGSVKDLDHALDDLKTVDPADCDFLRPEEGPLDARNKAGRESFEELRKEFDQSKLHHSGYRLKIPTAPTVQAVPDDEEI